MNKTAVIILHYKNENDTYECLETLHNNSCPTQYITIVVANRPSSKFISEIKSRFPKIIVISLEENIGFADGVNMGIKKAIELDCEYMILLNNDVLVGRDLVNKITDFAKTKSFIGLISPKIYFAPGCEYHKNRYKKEEKGKIIWYAGGLVDWSNIYASHRGVDEVDHGQYEEIIETDFATGCCMLIKRKVVDKIGFFDKKYFLYFEDIDYSMRAKNSGFQVVYYPGAFLWHKNASSSEKPGSPIHIYYQTRNRLYFGFKYASARAKKSLLIDSIKLAFKGGMLKKAALDYYLGRMGRGSL